jgi:adenylate cyclase
MSFNSIIERVFTPFGEQFTEEEFKRNLLESEKSRATILLWIFIFIWLAYILLIFILQPEFMKIFSEGSSALWLIIILSLLIIYEAGLRLFFKNLIKKRVTPPPPMRYINAFVETSIPAVLILVVSRSINPYYVLNGPAPFAFFIFIILATLRLDFFLCAFTGFVAALEFILLHTYSNTTSIDPTVGYLSNNLSIASKSLFLFVGGLAAGFVTIQIKRRIVTSIQTVEERDRVMNLFGQQVSQEVANELMNIKTEFAAQRRKVSIMFLDIRDYSLMVEDKDPEEIVKFQNLVFSFMADIVSKHNGIINQFLGDGFMATFGAPLSYRNDCQNAVNASFELLDEIQKRKSSGSTPGLKAGIGIHTGIAVTGNLGSSIRKQYSVTGTVVILANRIEQMNKVYSTTMLISREVYEELEQKKEKFELLGEVNVKGKEDPIILYKLN